MRRAMTLSTRALVGSLVLVLATGCPSAEPEVDGPEIVTTELPGGIAGVPYAVVLDARGGTGVYRWSAQGGSVPAGMALTEAGRLEGTPVGTGTHTLAVEVRDDAGGVANASLPLEIVQPLRLTAEVLPDAQTGASYAASFLITGGRQPYAFKLVNGQLPSGIDFEGASLTGTPNDAGQFEFVVEASDASGQFSRASFSLSVTAGPLRFDAPKLNDVTEGSEVKVQLSSSGGRRPVTFELASGTLPPGVTLSPGGLLSGTPTSTGTFSWVVRVRDSNSPPAQLEGGMTLNVLPRLRITDTSLPPASVGDPYSATLSASGGRPPYAWRIVSLSGPLSMTLSAAGTLSGTPQSTGSFTLEIEVKDADQRSVRDSFRLEVQPPSSITPSLLPDAYRSENYSQQFEMSGGGQAVWSVAGGALPAGLSLSSAGLLSGMPSATGSSSFTVKAVRDERTVTRTLTLTTYERPSFTSTSLADAYVGTAISTQLAATGGKPPLTFTAVSTVPPGLTLSSAGLLSGTPSLPGSFEIEARVTDANGRFASRVFTLDVVRPPTLNATSLPDGIVGLAYGAQLVAANGRPPLSFSVSSGALPRGISLSSSGQLSGYAGRAETRSFTVTVTDANSRTAQASFQIRTKLPGGSVTDVKVVGWNLLWFGAASDGPPRSGVDDELQIANVRTVLDAGAWDLAALVEVVDASDFASLVSPMTDYTSLLASDFRVSGGSAWYHSSEQKPALLWRSSMFDLVSAQVILAGTCTESSTGVPRDAFAGRPPLEVVLETTGSPAITLNVYVVHLKAFATLDDRFRREVSSGCLKTYLDALPSGRRALVIGDFNDDVDVSIVGGQPTPFANFVASSSYSFPTAALSAAGFSSTVSNPQMIDHQLVNSAMAQHYVAGSASVVRPDQGLIADYAGTTSDHYPVEAHYRFGSSSPAAAPYVFINEVRYTEPTLNAYDHEFVELVNAGDAPADLSSWRISDTSAVRHVFPAGTTLGPGKAIVVFGGASAIPAGLTNAVASSTGSLSFHPSDSVVLHDAANNVVDSHAWFSDRLPGQSDNRSPDGVPGRPFAPHAGAAGTASPGTMTDGSPF